MQANLVKQSLQDIDYLPTGGPSEAEFDLSGISEDVNHFIPSIDERLTTWSSLMNTLAQSTGAIWRDGPEKNTIQSIIICVLDINNYNNSTKFC
jgi:hypothetical protein